MSAVLGEFNLKSGRELLRVDQLDEVLAWHVGIGLRLRFGTSDVTANLDDSPILLVTELLRLARLGLLTQSAARMGLAQPQELVSTADVQWKQRF